MPLVKHKVAQRKSDSSGACCRGKAAATPSKKKRRKGQCLGMHREYQDFQIPWGLSIFENPHRWPTNHMTKTQQHACLSQGFFQCWAGLFDDSFSACLQNLINSSMAKKQIIMQKQNIKPPISSHNFPIKYKHQLH